MTEIINLQLIIFSANCPIRNDIHLEHKGISFHLEVNRSSFPRLTLLSSKYLQVFIFSVVDYNILKDFIDILFHLKYNNVTSKILIVELSHEKRPYYLKTLLENLQLEGYYMNFDDKEEFYNQEHFKEKLLEMSLENQEVIESSVVNDIFSQFLNTGKVEKTVVEDFCSRNSLDISYSLKILKENNNLFEYNEEYYFIHDKCLSFIQKISNLKFNNGMTTYEELEKIFENDTDLAINFLEMKNILIKSQDKYGYSFALPKYDIRQNPGDNPEKFIKIISTKPKIISLQFSLRNPINFPSFFIEISKNRIIVSISKNSIFIDHNIFAFFDSDIIKIYFFQEYDVEIITSILNFIDKSITYVVIDNIYRLDKFLTYEYIEKEVNEETEYLRKILSVIY